PVSIARSGTASRRAPGDEIRPAHEGRIVGYAKLTSGVEHDSQARAAVQRKLTTTPHGGWRRQAFVISEDTASAVLSGAGPAKPGTGARSSRFVDGSGLEETDHENASPDRP